MQKNKRNILLLGMLSAVTCFGIAGGLAFANTFKPVSADTIYEIQFSSSKNKLASDTVSTDVYTEKGTKYSMSQTGLNTSGSNWASFAKGATFYLTKNTDYLHDNGFDGMKTLQINFATNGVDFRIYFSNDGNFDSNYSRKYSSETSMTIEFEGHPNYFKFEALGANTINSMTLTHICNSAEDNAWNKSHGIVPVMSEVENTFTYGLYPQTVVSPKKEASLISALTEKAAALGVANEEYFWYNDEYYVKDMGNPRGGSYTFSDGTIVEETLYFFKCEPIKWGIVDKYGDYTIDCSNILYAHRFDDDSGKYVNSELRTWLNGDFYNSAFSTHSSYIIPTELSDDNVWVGSYENYDNIWYKTNEERQKKVTDFAICNGASMYLSLPYFRNGCYWTRSPFSAYSNFAYYVDDEGYLFGYDVDISEFGVSPSLTIKNNFES